MSCQFKDECPSASGWCEGPEQDFSRCIPFLLSAIQSRDRHIAELKSKLGWMRECGVLYQCDRRACDTCNPDCFLTKDICHAANFERTQWGAMQEVSR